MARPGRAKCPGALRRAGSSKAQFRKEANVRPINPPASLVTGPWWWLHAGTRPLNAGLNDLHTGGRGPPRLLPLHLLNRMGPGEGEKICEDHCQLPASEDTETHSAALPVSEPARLVREVWRRRNTMARRMAERPKPISSVIGKAATSVKAAAAARSRSHQESGRFR